MSSIKERVLLISEKKGISKTEFFKELNLSYANFKGVQKSTALSSDTVAIILTKYPDINPEWLVTGNADMFRDGNLLAQDLHVNYGEENTANVDRDDFVQALRMLVDSQQKTIATLEKQVALLEDQLALLRKD